MPGFDRTGPLGYGPMTGRGFGNCGGGMGFRRGRGIGFGRGFRTGRGFDFRYSQPVELTKEEQKRLLETELKDLESDKQEVEKRLKELK